MVGTKTVELNDWVYAIDQLVLKNYFHNFARSFKKHACVAGSRTKSVKTHKK